MRRRVLASGASPSPCRCCSPSLASATGWLYAIGRPRASARAADRRRRCRSTSSSRHASVSLARVRRRLGARRRRARSARALGADRAADRPRSSSLSASATWAYLATGVSIARRPADPGARRVRSRRRGCTPSTSPRRSSVSAARVLGRRAADARRERWPLVLVGVRRRRRASLDLARRDPPGRPHRRCSQRSRRTRSARSRRARRRRVGVAAARAGPRPRARASGAPGRSSSRFCSRSCDAARPARDRARRGRRPSCSSRSRSSRAATTSTARRSARSQPRVLLRLALRRSSPIFAYGVGRPLGEPHRRRPAVHAPVRRSRETAAPSSALHVGGSPHLIGDFGDWFPLSLAPARRSSPSSGVLGGWLAPWRHRVLQERARARARARARRASGASTRWRRSCSAPTSRTSSARASPRSSPTASSAASRSSRATRSARRTSSTALLAALRRARARARLAGRDPRRVRALAAALPRARAARALPRRRGGRRRRRVLARRPRDPQGAPVGAPARARRATRARVATPSELDRTSCATSSRRSRARGAATSPSAAS